MIKGGTGNSDEAGEDDADEADALSPAQLAALKKELMAAKKRAKALQQEFVDKLIQARGLLSTDDSQQLVLTIARSLLTDHTHTYVAKHRGVVTASLETWWDKYAITMRSLEAEREEIVDGVAAFVKGLGYE